MIDFTPVRGGNWAALQGIADGKGAAELSAATAELYEHIGGLLVECDDVDVTFQPADPSANDAAAASQDDVSIAWTLGHVIVHLTASCEESAALGAEQARGVAFHGRSRAEVPWETVTTIAQVRERLAESRRMALGALQMWPDAPDLTTTVETWPGGPLVNAAGRHLLGLMHADSHLAQIVDCIGQSHAARE
jgi:hypothetical protein